VEQARSVESFLRIFVAPQGRAERSRSGLQDEVENEFREAQRMPRARR
jgi:hypothetical protein